MTVIALTFIVRPLVHESHRNAVMTLGVGVPLFAAGFYMLLGSPDVHSPDVRKGGAVSSTSGITSMSGAGAEKVNSVASMVDGLAARLEENPDDAKSWLLLARSYQHLNRPEDAANAYAKATALGEHDAELERIEPTATVNAASSVRITGSLRLSERVASVVQPGDTVFIFVRGVDEVGPPAAVLRKSVSELPVNFELNDTQSIVESIKLSQFDQVFVTARISRSGDASDALQGLEAKSELHVVADRKPLTLIID